MPGQPASAMPYYTGINTGRSGARVADVASSFGVLRRSEPGLTAPAQPSNAQTLHAWLGILQCRQYGREPGEGEVS